MKQTRDSLQPSHLPPLHQETHKDFCPTLKVSLPLQFPSHHIPAPDCLVSSLKSFCSAWAPPPYAVIRCILPGKRPVYI